MKKIGLVLLTIFLISCEKAPVVRQYTETTIKPFTVSMEEVDPHAGLNLDMKPKSSMAEAMQNPKMNQMIQQSAAQTALKWKAPEGWSEQPASGLRLATFVSGGENPIECSIVALGGMAGGLESNVSRWANQVQLNISSKKMAEFIDGRTPIQSQSGLKGSLLDFSLIQSSDQNQSSILAVVFEIDETTVFIKMTGTQKAIDSNRQQFMELISSLQQ